MNTAAAAAAAEEEEAEAASGSRLSKNERRRRQLQRALWAVFSSSDSSSSSFSFSPFDVEDTISAMLQRLTASLEEVSSGDDGTSSADAAVASVLGQFGERARTLLWRRRIIQERLCADLLRTAAKHATPPAAAASLGLLAHGR